MWTTICPRRISATPTTTGSCAPSRPATASIFPRPGNGISHQVHLERFSVPGKTLLGSDSHTPTAGGAGMLALGAGGLDVALALAGQPFYLVMPEVLGVRLTGRFPAWVSAKDVILELLRRLTVQGGPGQDPGILRAGPALI